MSVKQISVFLENKPGMLQKVTEILTENGIDMRALSLADSADYGVLRVIVNNTEKALSVLSEGGYLAKVNDVLAVSVDDAPGGLAGVIALLAENGVNIEYLYVFVKKRSKEACAVFRVQSTEKAEAILKEHNVRNERKL